MSSIILEYEEPSNQICSIVNDKVTFRRRIVLDLHMNGLSQREISTKLGFSLSTIEKDFNFLRKNCKIFSLEEKL